MDESDHTHFHYVQDDLELVTFRIKQVVGLFLYLPAHAHDGWVNVELVSANKEFMVEEVSFVISGRRRGVPIRFLCGA